MIKLFIVVIPFLHILICSYFIYPLRAAIVSFNYNLLDISSFQMSLCLPHIECLLYLTLPFLDLFTPINMPSLSFDIVPYSFAKTLLAPFYLMF